MTGGAAASSTDKRDEEAEIVVEDPKAALEKGPKDAVQSEASKFKYKLVQYKNSDSESPNTEERFAAASTRGARPPRFTQIFLSELWAQKH